MTGGGFEDPDSESSRAGEVAARELGRGGGDVVVLYSSDDLTVDDPAYADRGAAAAWPRCPDDVVEQRSTYFGTGHRSWSARTGTRPTPSSRWPAATTSASAGLEQIERRPDRPRPRRPRSAAGRRINRDINDRVSADIARAETISLPILLVLLVDHLRQLRGGQPAAGDRRHRDPRRLHRAARVRRRSPTSRSSRSTSSRSSGSAWPSTTACSWSAGSGRRSAGSADRRGRRWPARWRPPAGRWRSPA